MLGNGSWKLMLWSLKMESMASNEWSPKNHISRVYCNGNVPILHTVVQPCEEPAASHFRERITSHAIYNLKYWGKSG